MNGVYPLSTLDTPSNLVTYFKWSPLVLNCLAEDTEFLINFLETQGQSYETITILGHSLGGVLLGKVLESVNTKSLLWLILLHHLLLNSPHK